METALFLSSHRLCFSSFALCYDCASHFTWDPQQVNTPTVLALKLASSSFINWCNACFLSVFEQCPLLVAYTIHPCRPLSHCLIPLLLINHLQTHIIQTHRLPTFRLRYLGCKWFQLSSLLFSSSPSRSKPSHTTKILSSFFHC